MLRQFARYLDKPWKLNALIVGYVTAAVLQGLTFVAFVPFLRDFLGSHPQTNWTWVVLGLGLAAFIVYFVSLVVSHRVSVIAVCGDLISKIGSRVTKLPLGWFQADTAGKVAGAVSNQMDTLSHLASIVIPGLVLATVTPATVLIGTLVIDWRLSAIMALCLPLWILAWRRTSAVLAQENYQETQVAAAAAGRLVEFAHLQPVLRARGVASSDWPVLANTLREENDSILAQLHNKRPVMALFALISQGLFAAVLGFGLYWTSGGSLDLAGYLAVVVVVARFAVPLSQSAVYISEIQKCRIALESIGEILDEPVLVEPARPLAPSSHEIEFHDVSFEYVAGEPLFDHLTLQVPKNQITALVGPSGCGKSTLTRLVARFWDVTGGKITIGSVDVRDQSDVGLMNDIAIVFQDVYLFDTTILENVRISRPQATDEQVLAAIKRARLDIAIAQLPQGIHTQVGEGGMRLSGGERQRVAIARAFLKDAPILLLDEITSALDAENEAALTDALTDLAQGRTVMLIAHRLSTIMKADQVVVLSGKERGEVTRIVQQGEPAQLARQDGIFAQLLADSRAVSRWRLG